MFSCICKIKDTNSSDKLTDQEKVGDKIMENQGNALIETSSHWKQWKIVEKETEKWSPSDNLENEVTLKITDCRK